MLSAWKPEFESPREPHFNYGAEHVLDDAVVFLSDVST